MADPIRTDDITQPANGSCLTFPKLDSFSASFKETVIAALKDSGILKVLNLSDASQSDRQNALEVGLTAVSKCDPKIKDLIAEFTARLNSSTVAGSYFPPTTSNGAAANGTESFSSPLAAELKKMNAQQTNRSESKAIADSPEYKEFIKLFENKFRLNNLSQSSREETYELQRLFLIENIDNSLFKDPKFQEIKSLINVLGALSGGTQLGRVLAAINFNQGGIPDFDESNVRDLKNNVNKIQTVANIAMGLGIFGLSPMDVQGILQADVKAPLIKVFGGLLQNNFYLRSLREFVDLANSDRTLTPREQFNLALDATNTFGKNSMSLLLRSDSFQSDFNSVLELFQELNLNPVRVLVSTTSGTAQQNRANLESISKFQSVDPIRINAIESMTTRGQKWGLENSSENNYDVEKQILALKQQTESAELDLLRTQSQLKAEMAKAAKASERSANMDGVQSTITFESPSDAISDIEKLMSIPVVSKNPKELASFEASVQNYSAQRLDPLPIPINILETLPRWQNYLQSLQADPDLNKFLPENRDHRALIRLTVGYTLYTAANQNSLSEGERSKLKELEAEPQFATSMSGPEKAERQYTYLFQQIDKDFYHYPLATNNKDFGIGYEQNFYNELATRVSEIQGLTGNLKSIWGLKIGSADAAIRILTDKTLIEFYKNPDRGKEFQELQSLYSRNQGRSSENTLKLDDPKEFTAAFQNRAVLTKNPEAINRLVGASTISNLLTSDNQLFNSSVKLLADPTFVKFYEANSSRLISILGLERSEDPGKEAFEFIVNVLAKTRQSSLPNFNDSRLITLIDYYVTQYKTSADSIFESRTKTTNALDIQSRVENLITLSEKSLALAYEKHSEALTKRDANPISGFGNILSR